MPQRTFDKRGTTALESRSGRQIGLQRRHRIYHYSDDLKYGCKVVAKTDGLDWAKLLFFRDHSRFNYLYTGPALVGSCTRVLSGIVDDFGNFAETF